MVVHHGWAGTHAYLDPMYEQLGQLCDRSDVYALGLIMAQLMMDSYDPKQAKRVLQHTAHEQKAMHLPEATGDWPRESALAFAELALHCAAADRQQRPSAAQLANELRQLVLQASREMAHSSSSGGGRGSSNGLTQPDQRIVRCPAFGAVSKLLPGKYGLVPSCLHGAAAPNAAAAAAAAAAALKCLASAAGSSSSDSCIATKAAAAAAVAGRPGSAAGKPGGPVNSSSSSSSAFAAKKQAAELAKLQQQQLGKLQRLVKHAMSVELLLEPGGSVSGGCVITAAAAAGTGGVTAGSSSAGNSNSSSAAASGAAAAAYAAGSWKAGQTAAAAGLHSHVTGGSVHSTTGSVGASVTNGTAGSSSGGGSASAAAAAAITASPVVMRVRGGWCDGDSGSIVCCCKGGSGGSSTIGSSAAASVASGTVAGKGGSSSSSSGTGASWYVFVGSYADGQLLGEWRLADAAVAVAELVEARPEEGQQAAAAACMLRVATSSSKIGGDGVAPVAAACFDWVMYHTYQQTA
jgi:hypothetical protein